MPTYEYKCDNCGHTFDIYQSMKDDKLTKCPVCEKETLKRLIGTGGGLIFKGTGFYLTDYKNKPAETTSTVNTSDSKETSSSKTETKIKPDTDKSENKNKKTSEPSVASKKAEVKNSSSKSEK